MGSTKPKSGEKHKVVCLDAFMCPVPKFSFPHEYVEYPNTIGEEDTIERCKDATIVITTRAGLTRYTLEHCPRLEFVAVMGAGTNFLDVEACHERGIPVCNCPSASAEAVAEHAFALYFAAKKRIVDLHNAIVEGKTWPELVGGFRFYNKVPTVSRHETMGIIGYGGLGKRIEIIGRALGMKVLKAERKSVGPEAVRPDRTSFDKVIRESTLLMIGCPLTPETRHMIGSVELAQMRKDSIVINVARGGVVDEEALVAALRNKTIAAAATDVFEIEPATAENNILVKELPPNLTMSPHTAWYADASLENLQAMIKTVVEGYVNVNLVNRVDQIKSM